MEGERCVTEKLDLRNVDQRKNVPNYGMLIRQRDVRMLEKAYIQAIKVINFDRGFGCKYKTFVILCKTPYSTLNQFVYSIKSFDIREDKKEVPHNKITT